MAVPPPPKKSPARQAPGVDEGPVGFVAAPGPGRPRRFKPGSAAARAVEEARQAGLLEGESSEHLSFRVPRALYEAAKREAGVNSPTDLGVAALAMMAQPDPVAAFFRETFGRLGADFDLDY